MASRGSLIVILAVLLSCVFLAQAVSDFGVKTILLSDVVGDSSGDRTLTLEIQMITTPIPTTSTITISGSSFTQTTITGVAPYTYTITPDTSVAFSCDDSSCTQNFIVVFTLVNPNSGDCEFSGAFPFSYYACDINGCSSAQTFSVSLENHNLCSSAQVEVSANITSLGAFADSLFSQTKNPYYIGDTVYVPFQITYADLTISSLSFDSIDVDSTSSSATLYSSSNTGAGNIVQLITSPITTQVGSGNVAWAWFSLTLSHQAGSPFAADNGLTSYTFNVVFDVEYKNSKRVVGQDRIQLKSSSSIMVSNKVSPQGNAAASSVQQQLVQKLMNSGAESTRVVGMLGVIVLSMLFLF